MKSLSRILVAVITAASFSSVLAATPADFVTPAQISSAKSPADFESIAKSYEAEAAVYDKKVDLHQSMAAEYGASGAKTPQLAIAGHCKQLAAKFRSIAKEYREMAAAEHKL